ncbi:MAG: acetylxylan esterase [Kiritimatiellae bacterium]|nr:acetylxylan esterase [Kiritimatiellia bacterium]
MNIRKDNETGRPRFLAVLCALAVGAAGCIHAEQPPAPSPAAKRLPAVRDLAVVGEFPDPLVLADGTPVKTKEQWETRRGEIKAMLQYYEYGHLPPPPTHFEAKQTVEETIYGGAGTYRRIQLSMGLHRAIVFDVHLYIPRGGKGPFPVILTGDMCWYSVMERAREFVKRGYVIAEFDRERLDHDNGNRLDGVHPLYPGYDWGTIAAWAWGYHRVVDYLVTADFVDRERIAVTGHSRGGKTALLAGAFDERIALTAPNGAGTCGSGPIRYRYTGESLDAIARHFPYWFNTRFLEFRGDNAHRLPFDQHSLIALVAPRAYLSTSAFGDEWANPQGTQAAHLAAQPVFEWLGAADKMGIHYRDGKHKHSDEDWQALVDFADKVFFGKHIERRFDDYPFDPAEKPKEK